MAGKKKGAYSSLSPHGKRKFALVMREFAEGKLRSSAGHKVTGRDQALAIAFSEARKAKG